MTFSKFHHRLASTHMAKRAHEQDAGCDEPVSKRWRPSLIDRLSLLSDELLLKVLTFLPVSQLVVCQRVSHKYKKLAGDGQLWKAQYYNRFVRPRASRLPGLKEHGSTNSSLHFASKASRWLDEDHLVKHGGTTDWKRQYKLRHNWSEGNSAVHEIPIAERQTIPPVLVQMWDGMVYMASQDDGLRAWSAGTRSKDVFAQIRLSSAGSSCPPTSLAIDTENPQQDITRTVVGFEDGSFDLYTLNHDSRRFSLQYSHESSSNGVIAATAMRWPHVVTMTATQLLSLYRFKQLEPERTRRNSSDLMDPPLLLHSLKSQSVWPPMCIQLRTTSTAVTICIAYALPTYLSGWTVGIQEVSVDMQGMLVRSRIASAVDQHYRPLAFSSRPMMSHLNLPVADIAPGPSISELRHIHAKPTTLSYTHPYLLVSHPDNTLTLYLVTSTADSLSISTGSRLWGHTSAVSGAHVQARGKAVSISRRGDELRVWELEGGFSSSSARKRLAGGDLSVKVKADNSSPPRRGSQTGFELVHNHAGHDTGADADEPNELTLTRGWIGFDDESVVVLKEHSEGKQSLVVYDFT